MIAGTSQSHSMTPLSSSTDATEDGAADGGATEDGAAEDADASPEIMCDGGEGNVPAEGDSTAVEDADLLFFGHGMNMDGSETEEIISTLLLSLSEPDEEAGDDWLRMVSMSG